MNKNEFKKFDLFNSETGVEFMFVPGETDIFPDVESVRLLLKGKRRIWCIKGSDFFDDDITEDDYKLDTIKNYEVWRDLWVKEMNYEGDDYSKYQIDFLNLLEEFEKVKCASEMQSPVSKYLFKIANGDYRNYNLDQVDEKSDLEKFLVQLDDINEHENNN